MTKKVIFQDGINENLFNYVKGVLESKEYKFISHENTGIIAVGLKGSSYQFNSFLICGTYYLTLSLRLPILLDASNFHSALEIARKYTVDAPIGAIEILRESGPVAVKVGFPIADQMPSADTIEHMFANALRLAEKSAGEFFDLVKPKAEDN